MRGTVALMSELIYEKKTTEKKSHAFLALIFAFISALLLWFYVLGYDSPNYQKEFTVSVKIEGESVLSENQGLTILSDTGISVKVVVSGPQSVVNKLRDSDIISFVDVSEVTEPGKNTLPIQVVLPDENNLSVKSLSVDNAVVYIDRTVTAEIPVRIDISDYSLSDGYSIGDFTTAPVTVTVQGPEAEISKISYAYGVVKPGKIVNSAKFNVPVSLYNEGGAPVNNSYIRLVDTSVNVEVPVYKTADIPIKVYFVGGYFSTESASITLSKEYITVRGSVEDVDSLDEIKINIAENTLTTETIEKKITLPAGLEAVDDDLTVRATIIFNDVVKRRFPINASEVCEFVNAPEGFTITVTTANMNIWLCGPKDTLNTLTSSSFRAVADLKDLEFTKNCDYTVPLDLIFADGITGVFPSGDYSVAIFVY